MKPNGIIIAAAVATGIAAPGLRAHASNVIVQQGKKDPTKNHFQIVTCCGSGATGKGKTDLGLPVWAMGGGDTSDQFGYNHPLTAKQSATVAKKGFVLTLVTRIIQGSAMAYTPSVPVVIGEGLLDTSTVRWEMDIGIDANGDPVVVLPNTIDGNAPGGAVEAFGASYTLTGAGSTYNTYQLVVRHGTGTLYVNGTQVLTGYTGETAFVGNTGLIFAVDSGGGANYNTVDLTSTTKLP